MAETKKPSKNKTPTLTPHGADKRDLERTLRMDAAPRPSIRAETMVDRPELWPTSEALPTAEHEDARGVEFVVIDETRVPGGERKPWRAAEVWTKRRVYGVDASLTCIEVLDRDSGRPDATHEMLGARLGGGRLRAKDGVRFSYPLPLPGMEAMFLDTKKHGYTSAVERMIVRVRVLHTTAEDSAPSWDEIATRPVPPSVR